MKNYQRYTNMLLNHALKKIFLFKFNVLCWFGLFRVITIFVLEEVTFLILPNFRRILLECWSFSFGLPISVSSFTNGVWFNAFIRHFLTQFFNAEFVNFWELAERDARRLLNNCKWADKCLKGKTSSFLFLIDIGDSWAEYGNWRCF